MNRNMTLTWGYDIGYFFFIVQGCAAIKPFHISIIFDRLASKLDFSHAISLPFIKSCVVLNCRLFVKITNWLACFLCVFNLVSCAASHVSADINDVDLVS